MPETQLFQPLARVATPPQAGRAEWLGGDTPGEHVGGTFRGPRRESATTTAIVNLDHADKDSCDSFFEHDSPDGREQPGQGHGGLPVAPELSGQARETPTQRPDVIRTYTFTPADTPLP